MAFFESNYLHQQILFVDVMNFKACLRDNSFNTPLPPLHKVPTEGFSAWMT